MVIEDITLELAKYRDNLYHAQRTKSTELVIIYGEVVRVLERIAERYYGRKRKNGGWSSRDMGE